MTMATLLWMVLFRWTIVVTLLVRGVEAFPNGAGSCDGNGPAFAVTTPHRDASMKTVLQENADQKFQFLIDGNVPIPGESLRVQQWYYWQVKSVKENRFKGFLVRLETAQGLIEFDLDCDTESPDSMQDADTQCASTYVKGCTHRDNVAKDLVTGRFIFSQPIALAKFDVTVVYENNSVRSRYAYQSYQMTVVDDAAGPAPSPSLPVNCFSSHNTVHEQQKGTIPISDLRVGDRVRTKGGEYTTVYSLGHWDPVRTADFLHLRFSDGTALELSDDHMIYVNGAFVAAKTVRVGDEVDGAFGERKHVTDIVRTSSNGLYAPLTEAGHLLVSDVLSSSYVDVMELGYGHELAHWMLAPVRMYCSWAKNCRHETHASGISNLIHPLVDVSLSIKTLYRPAQYMLVAVGATLMAPLNAF
jgi:hypothetical protein